MLITGAFKVALIFAEPITCNACPGEVVPMPTLPELATNKSPLLVFWDVTLNVPKTCSVCEGAVVFMPK